MPLPTFAVIGAAKAGTTSLYHYLNQHPDLYMSPVKEPNFFAFEGQSPHFNGPGDDWLNRTSVTDLDAYGALFAGAVHERARGEASPLYLYSRQAPTRMRRYVPEIRIIAILRDPAERAYSQFWHLVHCGREPLRDFARALEAEEARRQANWDPYWRYKDFGFYHRQLKRYVETFDRSQIRVYLYEDFGGDPAHILKDIFQFLDVDDAFLPDRTLKHNVSGLPRSNILHTLMQQPNPLRSLARTVLPLPVKRRLYLRLRQHNLRKPAMESALRRQLVTAYRDDILHLQDLLKRDLSGWLTC